MSSGRGDDIGHSIDGKPIWRQGDLAGCLAAGSHTKGCDASRVDAERARCREPQWCFTREPLQLLVLRVSRDAAVDFFDGEGDG